MRLKRRFSCQWPLVPAALVPSARFGLFLIVRERRGRYNRSIFHVLQTAKTARRDIACGNPTQREIALVRAEAFGVPTPRTIHPSMFLNTSMKRCCRYKDILDCINIEIQKVFVVEDRVAAYIQ